MAKSKTKRIALSAFLALMAAEILWGANKPIIKLGLETIPLHVYLAVTVLGTALLVLPLALRDWKRLALRDYLILTIGSIISISIGNVALLLGLQRVPAVNASLIGLFSPLLLLFFSIHFLKERLSVRALIGILVAFVGAAIIIGRPWEAQNMNSAMAVGNLFLILSVTADIIGTLVTKSVLKRGGLYQVTFIHLFAGILPIVCFSLPHLAALAPSQAQASGYIAMACNIAAITLANCFFMYGLKHKQAQEIGVFTYVSPIATFVAAWLILGETLTTKLAIGAVFIFAGVYLVSTKSRLKLPRK